MILSVANITSFTRSSYENGTFSKQLLAIPLCLKIIGMHEGSRRIEAQIICCSNIILSHSTYHVHGSQPRG